MRPLAGVVEQIAEHLVEILALGADDVRRIDADLYRQPPIRVQPQQRPGQPFRRREHGAVHARRRARRRGARLRQVIVHLPAHPLDLLTHHRRQLGLPGAIGDLRLVRQHGERRLQRVREIAGLGDRAADGLIAVLEQRVEIVDQRLHFGGIAAVEAALAALAHGGEAAAQPLDRRQAVAHVDDPRQHAGHDEQRHDDAALVHRRAVQDDRAVRLVQHDRRGDDHRGAEQAEGPEDDAEQDARAQRPHHRAASMR